MAALLLWGSCRTQAQWPTEMTVCVDTRVTLRMRIWSAGMQEPPSTLPLPGFVQYSLGPYPRQSLLVWCSSLKYLVLNIWVMACPFPDLLTFSYCLDCFQILGAGQIPPWKCGKYSSVNLYLLDFWHSACKFTLPVLPCENIQPPHNSI